MTLNIDLVKNSFNLIKDDAVKFSASFYNKLFDYHPELLPLFENTDLAAQEKKLIVSLEIIVENLRNPETLSMALKSLGAYHQKIGTMKEHYPFVGQALVETFAEYLGDKWDTDTHQAWLDAYSLISEIMLEGAKNPEAYLGGELTFYEWLYLYGESSPEVRKELADITHFKYRDQEASN